MANQKMPSQEVDSHGPEHATVADKKQSAESAPFKRTPLKIVRYMFNRLAEKPADAAMDTPGTEGSVVARRLGVCFTL